MSARGLALFIVLAICFSARVVAQETDSLGIVPIALTTLNDRDSALIIRAAEELIQKRLPDKMNRISDKSYSDPDVVGIIKSVFEDAIESNRRIFDNKEIIIEDDQTPDLVAEGGEPRNKTAFTYLHDFYSSYTKGNENSVECLHSVVTEIRPRSVNPNLYDTVFVTVLFDITYKRDWKGLDGGTKKFPVIAREALVKAFIVNQEWKALILQISFNKNPDETSFLGKYLSLQRKFPPKPLSSLPLAERQQTEFLLQKISEADSMYFSNSYSSYDLPEIYRRYEEAVTADPASSYLKQRIKNVENMMAVKIDHDGEKARLTRAFKNAHSERRYEDEIKYIKDLYFLTKFSEYEDLSTKMQQRYNRIIEIENHISNGNSQPAIAKATFEIDNKGAKDFEFYFLRAKANKDVNNVDALADANKAIGFSEIDTRDLIILRADILFSMGDFANAISDYQLYKNATMDKGYSYVIFRIGECYFNLKDWDRARDYYSKCIDLEKQNGMYYERRGDCYSNENGFEKAIDDYRQATRYAQSGQISYKAGNCYLKLTRPNYESAAKQFKEAKQYGVNPKILEEINERHKSFFINAKSKFQNHSYDEAAILFRSNVLLDPGNDTAWYYLGTIKYETKDYANARLYYDTCLMRNPSYLAAQIERGYSLLKLEKWEDAYDSFLRCKDSPGNSIESRVIIFNGLGDALTGQKKRKEANSIYQQSLTFSKQQADVHFKMGKNLYDDGLYKEAISKFGDARGNNPRHQDAIFWTGKSHFAMGKFSSAIENYGTVRETNMTYPHLLYETGNCFLSRALDDNNNEDDLTSAIRNFESEIQISGFKNIDAYMQKAYCEFLLKKYVDCGLTYDNSMKQDKDSTVFKNDTIIYRYAYSKIMINDKLFANDLIGKGFQKFKVSPIMHYAQACFIAFFEKDSDKAIAELQTVWASGSLTKRQVKDEIAFNNISRTLVFTSFVKRLK